MNRPEHKLQNPTFIPRSAHSLSRKKISKNALKVLYRLRKNGYDAYLVGGCVRDLLLGREPKDFDIATNAKPNEINKIFRNGRMIGKRFTLCHILFKNEIIEVSTFRSLNHHHEQKLTQSEQGIILEDNVYGSINEDAMRRDFTINAFYYNIDGFEIVDFHQGLADLRSGILRVIGDPESRYREDPVRVLRAVRLATKLGFRIETVSEQAIATCKHLLDHISPARLFTETMKIFMQGMALEQYKQLRHYELFRFLFPLTASVLEQKTFKSIDQFLSNALNDSDERIRQGKTVTPAFLIAAFLWYPLQQAMHEYETSGMARFEAFYNAANEIFKQQNQVVAVPNFFIAIIRAIWELQIHLENRKRQKCIGLVFHPRFRAGFDFLLLRSRIDANLKPLADWWHDFYHADRKQRLTMLNKIKNKSKKRRKKVKTT
ncbi:MAG: polynucleotide adenylyltransferase PcnB [Pseudomonadota bacterium]